MELPKLPIMGIQINEYDTHYNIVTQAEDYRVLEILDVVPIKDMALAPHDVMRERVESAQKRVLVRNFVERLEILRKCV